ncbi:beta-alanyl-dopamine/carcinine hydrolase [Onthophagus taurus]|uniref:beta-alanyl-dopamine/carcinine hydrolase n=1 Tax=Onthophagus taurus TaxID=166361 RepID=UPI0039BE38A4
MSNEITIKRKCIPIIYTRGTHYEVGFDIGTTFGSMIHDLLEKCVEFLKLPTYETESGKEAYENTLAVVKENFPQYIEEIQGIADGAKVPFYKLFLLHMDDIMPSSEQNKNCSCENQLSGCSTICVNTENVQILAHNEDVLSEMLDLFYLVSVHIVAEEPRGRWGVKEEKFTSLSYAGHLPGYTMGYNHHGLIFTINTLAADKCLVGKTPRYFITRALLAAENFEQAEQIIQDLGCGAGNGCSINMTFLKPELPRIFYNIEMGPAYDSQESQLNVITGNCGETLAHFNMYLRLPVQEIDTGRIIDTSICRMAVYKNRKEPKSLQDVLEFLGETNKDNEVYQNCEVRTVATGIFDCIANTWTLYADNPKTSEPLVVLPLILKS